MNINNFVILPGSKSGTSVRLKTKTVKELQLEKVQLETENREMEKRLRQLQPDMSREKEERKKLGAYHWKSGQAGARSSQARVVAQNNVNRKKVSPEKVKLQVLKEQVQEPVKEPGKPAGGNVAAHEKCEVKGVACGRSEMKAGLLEPASESACAGLGKQDKGLLLRGAYDEESSAKSFQEALLQWRKGKRDPGEELHASEVPSEAVGTCEVQTNVSVQKEPIQVEFQKDGLSYMEKLLLKKYRRTPADQIFESCLKDSRPVQALSVHQAGTGGGGERSDDHDDIEDLTDEEVKKYWASVYRVEEPNTVPEHAESSLKIEFLDDPHSKDLEESSDSLVETTGAVGMNKQGKTDPLEQCGRNPVSPQEISPEKLIVCSDLERNAVQEENIDPKTGRRSLSPCDLPEISNPTEVVRNQDLLESELKSKQDLLESELKSKQDLLESELKSKQDLLGAELRRNQGLLEAELRTNHDLLEAELRSKQDLLESELKSNQGLLGAELRNSQGLLGAELRRSQGLCGAELRSKQDFLGAELRTNQGLLEAELRTNQDLLETQVQKSSREPQDLGSVCHSHSLVLPAVTKSSLQDVAKRQKSASASYQGLEGFFVLGANPEEGKLEAPSSPRAACSPLDRSIPFLGDGQWVSERSLSEYADDSVVQGVVESELNRSASGFKAQNKISPLMVACMPCPGPENSYSLTGEDETSSSNPLEKICGNPEDSPNTLELEDYDTLDIFGDWDESQMDDEEAILEDKQQVLALQ